METVRLQAPSQWARRTLSAADPQGGPFVAVFDDRAQTQITSAQAAHLQSVSHISLTVILEREPETEDDIQQPVDPRPKRPRRKKDNL